MLHDFRICCASILAGLTVSATAVPMISVANDKSYRATSGESFDYRGGELVFFIFDGNAFSNVECPSLPAGPPIGGFPQLPFFPGALPCPAGHNAFTTIRFGDRPNDVITQWNRLGAVNEATRIPPGLPELIRLEAAPVTDLPRPSQDFSDRSTLVLHDLQSATFEEKIATRYEMQREYLVFDADTNGDGVLTDFERQTGRRAAQNEEIRQIRETLITAGNSNGYLFSYPILPWISLFRDRDPNLAPRDTIAVNQLKFIEPFPGVSKRAGISSAEEGFRFRNLNNFGTDFDGDPAVLVDFRVPGLIAWEGNDPTTLIAGTDEAFLKIFERRFSEDGTPVSFAGVGETAATGLVFPVDPTQATVLTAPGHGLTDGEEFVVYRTGLTVLDGQRFFASFQSEIADFDADDQIELFLDDGLTVPLNLTAVADGTQGFIDPVNDALPNVGDITIIPGNPVVVETAAPHGIADGTQLSLVDTGLTAFGNQRFFAGNVTDTTIELFVDDALTLGAELDALPDPTGLTAAILGTDQNDFEFPIYPFPFVDQSFGGQLLLPSVYDRAYEIPDIAFRLFYGTEFGATDVLTPADPPRNDLILRIRFSRNVVTADLSGTQALIPGDLSRRDFELELCLVDSFRGALKSIVDPPDDSNLANLKSTGTKSKKVDYGQKSAEELDVDGDLDNDGQSNLFEFAFDANGSFFQESPPMADPGIQISAQVAVEINPETKLCELAVAKRPGVREYLEYYFEQVEPDGTVTLVDPSFPEVSGWKLIADDNKEYRLVSTQPVSGTSMFRACARENTFGVEAEGGE